MNAEFGLRNAEGYVPHGRDLRGQRNERGMTLFEVLLVLVLLVVMGSLAKPALEGTLASFRLQRGTDQVLSDWAKVRTRAIEDGQVYQFRFAQDSNEYRVDPWYAEESYQPSTAGRADDEFADSSMSDFAEQNSTKNEDKIEWQFKAKISDTVKFVSGQQAVVKPPDSREVETLASEDSTDWSAPILFFPDGTTSEASLLLRGEKNRYQRATLRALTGSGRGSALLTATEIDEQEAN